MADGGDNVNKIKPSKKVLRQTHNTMVLIFKEHHQIEGEHS